MLSTFSDKRFRGCSFVVNRDLNEARDEDSSTEGHPYLKKLKVVFDLIPSLLDHFSDVMGMMISMSDI